MPVHWIVFLGIVLPAFLQTALASDRESPEARVGERLFRETRFSQFFQAYAGGDVNARLAQGDPLLEKIETPGGPVANPYAGSGMNCASCHLSSEVRDAAGQRAHGDFAARSAIPDRGDGRSRTLRNSPAIADMALEREVAFFMHYDGEFATVEDLVRGGFTGRNFGWLGDEKTVAAAWLARVIREDDGTGGLARSGGGAYRDVLAGRATDPGYVLPERHRLDVASASDVRVLDAVAELVAAYLRSLRFSRDAEGDYDGSPYDLFLRKNGLPLGPDRGESAIDYSRRLLGLLEKLAEPRFVTAEDGAFRFHAQKFEFGTQELNGLKIFLREPPGRISPAERKWSMGNCASCHAPPTFTDFSFHNTGMAQEEYETVHGFGTFEQIGIPTLDERAESGLLRSDNPFLKIPSAGRPGETDLGVWSVFLNPDMPAPQAGLREHLCAVAVKDRQSCDDESLLALSAGMFKTPSLRDLGHSAPYFHTGQIKTLEDTVMVYLMLSAGARSGTVLNADPEMKRVMLNRPDIGALAAFLRALNEDYE